VTSHDVTFAYRFAAAVMSNQQEEDTQQDKTKRKDKRKRIDESIEHCTHVLSVLLQKPELWCLSTFKLVRECLQMMKANPQQFSPVVGDNIPDGKAYSDDNSDSEFDAINRDLEESEEKRAQLDRLLIEMEPKTCKIATQTPSCVPDALMRSN
jgi:hypothetical protein